MPVPRGVGTVAKLIVLIVAGIAIAYYWRIRLPQDVIDDAKADLLEQTGDTYVPVHATTICRRTLHQYVVAYGRVEPAPATAEQPAAIARLGSPSAALIAQVNCAEGQRVRAGQQLFSLDRRASDAAIVADRAIADSADARLKKQSTDPATPQWVIAQSQHEMDIADAALKRDAARAATLTVSSPIAGVVTRVNISAGEIADPDRIAVEVVDPDRLIIALDVPAAQLAMIHVGDEAIGAFDGRANVAANATAQIGATLPANAAASHTGSTTAAAPAPDTASIDAKKAANNAANNAAKVVRIDPTVDSLTRLASVDVALPEHAPLRDGQTAMASIIIETKPNCLVVPASSIVNDAAGQPTVAVVDADGRWATQTIVRRGITEGDDVQISGEAIDAGMTVVTTGAYGLAQRTRIHLLKD